MLPTKRWGPVGRGSSIIALVQWLGLFRARTSGRRLCGAVLSEPRAPNQRVRSLNFGHVERNGTRRYCQPDHCPRGDGGRGLLTGAVAAPASTRRRSGDRDWCHHQATLVERTIGTSGQLSMRLAICVLILLIRASAATGNRYGSWRVRGGRDRPRGPGQGAPERHCRAAGWNRFSITGPDLFHRVGNVLGCRFLFANQSA